MADSQVPSTPQVRTLLLTDLVDSTALVERIGDNAAAAAAFKSSRSAVILCVKPQRMSGVLKELSGSVNGDQLVISIVAGTTQSSTLHQDEQLGTVSV